MKLRFFRDILDENDFDRAASDIDITIDVNGQETPSQEKEIVKKYLYK